MPEAGLAAGGGLRGGVPGQEGMGLTFKLGRRGCQEVSLFNSLFANETDFAQ